MAKTTAAKGMNVDVIKFRHPLMKKLGLLNVCLRDGQSFNQLEQTAFFGCVAWRHVTCALHARAQFHPHASMATEILAPHNNRGMHRRPVHAYNNLPAAVIL